MSFLAKYCTRKAAKMACKRWHYSRTMPPGKGVFIGIWEEEAFIGSVIFSRGANNNIGRPYGLKQTEICELARVALKDHKAPVSQIISVCLGILRKKEPSIQVVVSYADSEQGHLGKVYQAGNWIHDSVNFGSELVIHGKRVHTRTITSKYGRADISFIRGKIDPEAYIQRTKAKYRYIFPMNKRIRRKLQSRALPYPKNAGASREESSYQGGQAGSIPSPPLQAV